MERERALSANRNGSSFHSILGMTYGDKGEVWAVSRRPSQLLVGPDGRKLIQETLALSLTLRVDPDHYRVEQGDFFFFSHRKLITLSENFYDPENVLSPQTNIYRFVIHGHCLHPRVNIHDQLLLSLLAFL